VPAFRLGINYWPRRSAMYMWQRLDLGEIAEDFAQIAELGFRTVRFFLRWDDFQPRPGRTDSRMLHRLIAVMDALQDTRLDAMATLFTGHMSGVNWLPDWTLDPKTPHGRFRTYSLDREMQNGIGDFYTGELLAAQVLHAREVGSALRGHPALWVWDLGNEFSNLREPARPQDAAHWSTMLTQTLRRASGAAVTAGTHGEDITRDRHIRPSSICEPWVFATMHGYSVYSEFARDRLDTEAVPFLCQVMQSCARKPVLFSEFGNPTCPPTTGAPHPQLSGFECLSEEEMSAYGYAVLDRLQSRGALGAFWWCYADYAKTLAALPPFDRALHELTFGIVREDGTLKPIAETLHSFAKENRTVIAPPRPIVDEAEYFSGMPQALEQAYAAYLREYE